ncbi:SERTA domain-containing protein 2 [Denticeps clupeoides]|uniref:SERTA domain-containing protein 2 n=1 Tax=Denticeps clupeoides TaxID=299321 RepID=UPI0010A570A9|nr:SERTA domain-containing protein 2-like [Denticeps clupeoides]
MLGKGLKRKLQHDGDYEEGGTAVDRETCSYNLQRQTVFNLSLLKLSSPFPQPAVEPRLQRHVLIANTLRRIKEEFQQEDGLPGLFLAGESASDPWHKETAPTIPPSAVSQNSDLRLSPVSFLEDDRLHHGIQASRSNNVLANAPDMDESCPPPMVLNPTPSKTGGQECTEIHTKKTDRAFDISLVESKNVTADLGLASVFSSSSFSFASSSGFLADLVMDDLLFTDIDTSMYDLNLCSSNTGSSKVVSLATAEDLVRSLSTCGNSELGSTGVAQSQPFKMDFNELDHIMKLLFGS